ncbi:hypothetical protein ZTR_00945 [Talaromyces verruculosus]|nr:hypothetical protein ZTR_00945 [Talaromyces verruculosus]
MRLSIALSLALAALALGAPNELDKRDVSVFPSDFQGLAGYNDANMFYSALIVLLAAAMAVLVALKDVAGDNNYWDKWPKR